MSPRPLALVRPATVRTNRPEFSASNIGPSVVGEAIDPFIGIDHFVMRVPVFPPHPHAGFSAVTYLFEDAEGPFTNRDSLGNALLIHPGELHWTTAGRGILHEEIPRDVGTRVHGLQIFVNLRAEAKLSAPSVHHRSNAEIPVRSGPGLRARVLLGSSGAVSVDFAPPTAVTLLDVFLEAGATFEHALHRDEHAFVYVITGQLDAVGPSAARTLSAGEVGVFAPAGDAIVARAPRPTHAILFAGAPLREPMAASGPFVMSTEQQLREAFSAYRSGRMGHLEPTATDAWLTR
jgi:redox-sensitive bicupin YhaK (pirin superfamily)